MESVAELRSNVKETHIKDTLDIKLETPIMCLSRRGMHLFLMDPKDVEALEQVLSPQRQREFKVVAQGLQAG
jgi:hypothetical protein